MLYSPASDTITLGASLPAEQLAEDEELVTSSDRGTIYLSLPKRDEIVRVVDAQ
ncbi:MAG: hypothetical protein AMXMBFR13_15590 [Phycisphaerae bacterium]